MVKVTFVNSAGKRQDVETPEGKTLLEVAMKNDVDGIIGECGGSCSCATCHVYVEQSFFDKLPKADPMEVDMLDFATHSKPNSRLACQIKVVAALDGMVITTPVDQG